MRSLLLLLLVSCNQVSVAPTDKNNYCKYELLHKVQKIGEGDSQVEINMRTAAFKSFYTCKEILDFYLPKVK